MQLALFSTKLLDDSNMVNINLCLLGMRVAVSVVLIGHNV